VPAARSGPSSPRGEGAEPSRWSQRVTRESNALDLDAGVFTWDDPHAIAQSLKDSAERSARRKADPFRSAMSMLTFYVNRAGRQLPAERRAILDAAKEELRALFDRPRKRATPAGEDAERRVRRARSPARARRSRPA
jgi:hypothetical protein